MGHCVDSHPIYYWMGCGSHSNGIHIPIQQWMGCELTRCPIRNESPKHFQKVKYPCYYKIFKCNLSHSSDLKIESFCLTSPFWFFCFWSLFFLVGARGMCFVQSQPIQVTTEVLGLYFFFFFWVIMKWGTYRVSHSRDQTGTFLILATLFARLNP